MNINQRIESFRFLGLLLKQDKYPEVLQKAIEDSVIENPWFTEDSVRYALSALGEMMDGRNLERWLEPYLKKLSRVDTARTVGVVMAGNIPMAGFHDMLCILISGHRIAGKLSSNDRHLLPALARLLVSHNPEWEQMIRLTGEKISGFQAVIATGSNNSSRYFEYYFGKYPNIIRRNRNSIAILTGHETKEELERLADDLFLYFGLGCRNVSKIYLPERTDPGSLRGSFNKYGNYMHHHKFRNNYEYNLAVYLVNGTSLYDGGYYLMTESKQVTSPVSVIHYEHYSDPREVRAEVEAQKDQIQCVVCHQNLTGHCIPPGKSQQPELWDYADNIDTLEFLLEKI